MECDIIVPQLEQLGTVCRSDACNVDWTLKNTLRQEFFSSNP